MKILIISPPRCGSTSLLNNISLLRSADRIAEPYTNPKELISRDPYPYPLPVTDNCVVKMITSQVPEEFGKPNEFCKFIKTLYKDYDRTIILGRKNLNEHFESFLNLRMRLNKENVHAPWYINELETYNKSLELIDQLKATLKKNLEMINQIQIELNIPIIFYEDLYGSDREKSFNILKNLDLELDVNLLNKKLHPKFKYRQKELDKPLI